MRQAHCGGAGVGIVPADELSGSICLHKSVKTSKPQIAMRIICHEAYVQPGICPRQLSNSHECEAFGNSGYGKGMVGAKEDVASRIPVYAPDHIVGKRTGIVRLVRKAGEFPSFSDGGPFFFHYEKTIVRPYPEIFIVVTEKIFYRDAFKEHFSGTPVCTITEKSLLGTGPET